MSTNGAFLFNLLRRWSAALIKPAKLLPSFDVKMPAVKQLYDFPGSVSAELPVHKSDTDE